MMEHFGCGSAGAADHQASKQQPSCPELQASDADTPRPNCTSTKTTPDGITFQTPLAGRPLSAAKAAPNSPDPVAPTTPDHTPAVPPCKVNPMRDYHTKRASQNAGHREEEDVLSSFQQLLGSRDGDQQDRLSKFQQLLASQEVDDDGKPMAGLAGRVRTMAAQLNALQKRTQVRNTYSSSISSQESVLLVYYCNNWLLSSMLCRKRRPPPPLSNR